MYNPLEDILVYYLNGKAYCETCFVDKYFGGSTEQLEETVLRNSFKTSEGDNFGFIHTETVQGESYPHQIIPVEGVYCCKCGMECIEPDEMYLLKHELVCPTGSDVSKLALLIRRELDTLAVNFDIKRLFGDKYMLTFYSYETIAREERKRYAKMLASKCKQVFNEPVL